MSKTFVIDASVVMSWCFRDEACKYADTILESMHTSSAIVPAIWPLGRITLTLALLEKELILLDIGNHDEVYR